MRPRHSPLVSRRPIISPKPSLPLARRRLSHDLRSMAGTVPIRTRSTLGRPTGPLTPLSTGCNKPFGLLRLSVLATATRNKRLEGLHRAWTKRPRWPSLVLRARRCTDLSAKNTAMPNNSSSNNNSSSSSSNRGNSHSTLLLLNSLNIPNTLNRVHHLTPSTQLLNHRNHSTPSRLSADRT